MNMDNKKVWVNMRVEEIGKDSENISSSSRSCYWSCDWLSKSSEDNLEDCRRIQGTVNVPRKR